MVETVRYSQLANAAGSNVVNVTGFFQEDVTGSAWGFNIGGDASWFFTRRVGVGAGLRFNAGDVTILEPLSLTIVELPVGSTSFVAGARFRF